MWTLQKNHEQIAQQKAPGCLGRPGAARKHDLIVERNLLD
jgi:hypothetical protein